MPVQPQKGYTIIEMLIVLTIVIVLFSFSFPLGRDFILKNKLSARTEEIVSALHFARSQANLLGHSLVLRAIKNEDWSLGMVLFFDKNNNYTFEPEDNLLFQWQWADSEFSLTWKGMYDDYLLFTPTELTSVLGGSFYLCAYSTSINGKRIQMNRIGRIRVEEDHQTCHT